MGWSEYQGPPGGVVTFDPKYIEVYAPNDRGTTTVTFSEVGRYVLLVQGIDWPDRFDRRVLVSLLLDEWVRRGSR